MREGGGRGRQECRVRGGAGGDWKEDLCGTMRLDVHKSC